MRGNTDNVACTRYFADLNILMTTGTRTGRVLRETQARTRELFLHVPSVWSPLRFSEGRTSREDSYR